MIETGRWFPPSGRYTLRLPFSTLFEKADVPTGSAEEALQQQLENALESGEIASIEEADGWTADNIETFVDAVISDGKLITHHHSIRRQFPGKSVFQKQMILRSGIKAPPSKRYYGLREWWERGGWLCERWNVWTEGHPDSAKLHTFIEQQAVDVLTIILHDRSVCRVDIEPKADAPNWPLLRLTDERPAIPTEITLHCPRRVYTGDNGGTHASPRAHYRAEHLRQQAHGPGRSLRKEIVIAAQWINAADIDPSELGTPIRHYKLET